MAFRTRPRTSQVASSPQMTLAPVVLLRAAEAVLADRAVAELIRAAKTQDSTTQIVTVDAAAYEPKQLQMWISPSLFEESRLVYVPDLENMNEALLNDLLSYIPHADPAVVVLLRHNGGVRGKKLLNLIDKSPYPVFSIAAVKSAQDKAALVSADVQRAGRKIDSAAVEALVDALGSDLRELLGGVQQLLDDTQGTITTAQVHTYYAGRLEATGFTVADAVVSGDVAKAVTTLRHAVATGTDPVQIVAALAVKLRQLARVVAAGRAVGATKNLGMAPWQVQRVKRELATWSDDALAQAIVIAAAADAQIKSGTREAMYAVEKAVVDICRTHAMQARR